MFSRPVVTNATVQTVADGIRLTVPAEDYLDYEIVRITGNAEKELKTVKNKGVITVTDTLAGGSTVQYRITPKLKTVKNGIKVTGEPYVTQKLIVPYSFAPPQETGGNKPKADKTTTQSEPHSTPWWELLPG